MTEQLELELSREPAPAPTPAPALAAAPAPAPVKRDADAVQRARERARALAQLLSAELAGPVRLMFTDNRRTMISTRREGAVRVVRVHHIFLEADRDVALALARYLRDSDRAAGEALDAFIAAQRAAVVASRQRSTVIVTRGRYHDLREIFDDLAARCFEGPFGAQITWGAARRRPVVGGRQRSIQLGVYLADQRLIRINPVLDQAWVPRFYVESVVHHEMLHHRLPGVLSKGRRMVHTSDFRRLEAAFEHYEDAKAWEERYLSRLLRGGAPA